MTELRIGKADGRPFTLPADVAGLALAILAKRGAGKSNTAAVIAEEMIGAGVQVVILDPVGAHWGIRYGADGKSPGHAIPILGGQHGDVPLQETAGELVADVVVDTGASMLLDLSDFETKAAMNRFAAAFAKRLFYRKGRSPSLLHLVLEEAHQFCPQSRARGEEVLVGAYSRLVTLGRARGIGLTMISQRSAKLNKDILTQADVLIAMKTTGPNDRATVKAWIDHLGAEAKEVMATLPGLQVGEAWVWNSDSDRPERVSVRLRSTYDSSRQAKHGEKRAQPTAAAAINLEALGEQIAATAEKAKANDPKVLHKRIRELEAQVRKAARAAPAAEYVEAAREEGRAEAAEEHRVALGLNRRYADKLGAALDHTFYELKSMRDNLDRLVDTVQAVLDETAPDDAAIHQAQEKLARPTARTRSSRQQRLAAPAARVRVAPESRNPAVPATNDLTGPQKKILTALAWFRSVGIDVVARPALGALAGYKKGGHYDSVVSGLRTAGLVDYPSGNCVSATAAGADLVVVQTPLSLEDLQEAWLAVMNGPQQIIMRALLAAWPEALSREELLARTGYSKGGHFDSVVSSIKTMGAAVYPTRGFVVASDNVFPEGLL